MSVTLSVIVKCCSSPIWRSIERVERCSSRSTTLRERLERFLTGTVSITLVLHTLRTHALNRKIGSLARLDRAGLLGGSNLLRFTRCR